MINCYVITYRFLLIIERPYMKTQAAKLRRKIRIERRVGALAAALCAAFGAQAAEISTKAASDDQAAAPQSNVAASTQAQPVELNPIVVTATRNAQRRDEVASSMEVVEGHVLEETVGNTFLDQLKKN